MYTTTEVVAGSEPISFQQFQENISKQMNLPIDTFELRYKDDEGDIIAISSDMELQEAVRQASTRTPAVIEVIVETRQTTVEKASQEQKGEEKTAVHKHSAEEPVHPEGISEIILHQAVCSNCQFPIVGVRYKCGICPHFDLCEICEMVDNSHPVDHPLIKAKRPISPEFTHILHLSYNLHNASKTVEKGYHKAADGLHHGFQQIGTNVQYFGSNVQQYGTHVGYQIKQTWQEHQPQIDAARQRAYEKWNEVKEQVKVISENMKVKAKEFSETLKKESSEWFKESETTYPGTISTTQTSTTETTPTAPAPAPVPAAVPTPIPMPAPVLAQHQSTSPPSKADPQQQPRQAPVAVAAPTSTPAVVASHPCAPTQPATPTQFQQQLATLSSMGFTDVNRNVALLSRYGGDVALCVQALVESTA